MNNIRVYTLSYLIVLISLLLSCTHQNNAQTKNMDSNKETVVNKDVNVATFGAGCFWCVEAVFQRLDGVKSVIPGYAGGKIKKPSYRQVCTGSTGHAEVAQITFDPKIISYKELLDVFWRTHNPTTLNRQGNDVGTQYRSVIFYHTEEQREIAEKSKKEAGEAAIWKDPIVTEISPLTNLYEAENYHQNYYNDNRNQPYCIYVIDPKIEKLTKEFKDKLKKEK